MPLLVCQGIVLPCAFLAYDSPYGGGAGPVKGGAYGMLPIPVLNL